MHPRLQNLWLRFAAAVADVERDSADYRARATSPVDWHVIGVIIFASFMLSLQEYYGSSSDFTTLQDVAAWFGAEGPVKALFSSTQYGRLARLWYWSLATSLCYLLLPALYIKLVMRARLRDFGFRLQGILSHAWLYGAMFLLILPLLFLVGGTPGFQKTYPFYKEAGRSPFDFFMWEIAYIAQFMSLEFFFRGFLVHGLKHRMGYYAILVAVMPYCMIHFGKPMPETLGAIFAGLALGTLSLFTRSIWLGVAIHVSVAISMDLIALWYRMP